MSEKNNTKSETNSKFREGLNELLKQTKSFIFEEAQSIILFLIALLLLFLFEDETKALFYDKVLPVMNRMNFGIVSWSILSLLGIFHLHYVWQCVKNNYRISVFSFLLITLVIILLFNGLLLDYSSIEIQILIFFVLVAILCFWMFSFINFFPCQSGTETQAEEEKLLSIDTPIKNKDDDRLGFSEDIDLLISKLPKETEQAYSVGIVGSWGSGKTSYLNLLEKKLNKEQFIVIKFNPRHSLNACTIQEDFFHELFSTLKKYDSRFSSSFKDYLKAINIIGENKFLSSFLSIHQLWNSGREKQKISEAIKRLGKRVVVFIDDFDRLLREEVIEVLKLIDGNASFSNMIFFAAYDKQYLNKILVSENTSETKLFSDKYFSIEQSIPFISEEALWNEITKIPCMNNNDPYFKELYEKESILYFILNQILPTLRDLKRFSNLFLRFEKIQNDVNFRDYFLLMLIKYNWENEYYRLKKKQYLNPTNSEWEVISEKVDINVENSHLLKKILHLLFEKEEVTIRKRGHIYRIKSIRSIRAFEIYFQERVNSNLSFNTLEHLLKEDACNSLPIIDLWFQEGYDRDILEYLSYYEGKIMDKHDLSKFLSVAIYAYEKDKEIKSKSEQNSKSLEKTAPDQRKPYTHEYTQLKPSNFECFSHHYIYKISPASDRLFASNEEYKIWIKDELKKLHIHLYCRCALDISEHALNDDHPCISKRLFNLSEAREIVKDSFLNLIHKEPEIKTRHMDLLESYIKPMEKEKTELNKEMLEAVITSLDNYGSEEFFRKLFVKIPPMYEDCLSFGLTILSEKIFGTKGDLDKFLTDRKHSIKIPDKIKKFWSLYKGNNYEVFSLYEDIQYDTEWHLKTACNNLEKVLEIEHKFDELVKDGKITLKRAESLLETIRKFPVRVSKYQDVVNKINQKIDELSKS
ncbi:KAP family P-loop NTPase fold protein [Porphyromonas cangingivalis]|uniref:KAP family P-loop domain-containing protein n=1 Tax=Porphyromonas cangingivalis TaxID=36874 RepID=A0A1T4NTB9_PORCN|nr:P-loop NTPase fold protein [Porphyromonas cangingivalis]SJZ82501.1 KAP family P-loop domain-containing protein [Porphyromonas cangingivalis]VEJ03880.1 Predicted P-loop ATPase [Porphyromonas cangingivalis]